MATVGTSNAALDYDIRDSWSGGLVADLTLTTDTALSGWQIAFDYDGEIVNIWNAQIVSRTGNRYVVEAVDYNSTLGAGGSAGFGFQGSGSSQVITPVSINGTSVGGTAPEPQPDPLPELVIGDAMAAEEDGAISFTVSLSEASDTDVVVSYQTMNGSAQAGSDFGFQQSQITIPAGQTSATISVALLDDSAAESTESFRVDLTGATGAQISDGTATGQITDSDPGTPSDPAPTPGGGQIADGPLSTSGNQIIDADGNAVQIRAVNWFGAENNIRAPHGLWQKPMTEMMDQMAAEGFNAIRLPFSVQNILENQIVTDVGGDPSLQGLTTLEIFDRIIDYADQIGLKIILDAHRITQGNGAEGIWYAGQYDEQDWVDAWQLLAARYGDAPAVIAADLLNEPHLGTWGTGQRNDWAAAAELAGNAVLDVAPDWLILVEGIGNYNGESYWWGGQLQGVRDRPVVLNAPDKLVYSPHDYPASIFPQSWFTDGSNLYDVFRENWGFIYEEGIAPILLGEFGSRLENPLDLVWAEAITNYLGGDFDGDGVNDLAPGAAGPSFAWWSWNPNSGDTGGYVLDDWTTVRQNAADLLDPLLEGEPAGSDGHDGHDHGDMGDMGDPPADADPGDGNGDTGGGHDHGDHDHGGGSDQFTDITIWGSFHGSSSHTGHGELAGGRTAITTEALIAYNGLRNFLGLQDTAIETIGEWAFANGLTNNTQPYGQDLQGVGLWYAMQGAKVGWIRDDAFDPQILADIQREARLGDPAVVMQMVESYGHDGFADYLTANGLADHFVNTLKMEPHYGGWMHGRTHGGLTFPDGMGARSHDVNHLTVLSHDQTQPFMNDTFDWPQWPALDVPHQDVIDYFQSMVVLGDPLGDALPSGTMGDPVDPVDPVDPDPVDPDPVDPDPVDPDPVDPPDYGDQTGGDSGNDGTGSYELGLDDWGSGFVARFYLTPGEAVNGGWTASIAASAMITNVWNAEIVSHENGVLTLRNASWNASIGADETIEVGVQGNGSAAGLDLLATTLPLAGVPDAAEDPMDGGSGDNGNSGGMGDGGDMGGDSGSGNSGPFVGGGQTYFVGQTSVVTGFDPTRDVLDLGPNSIHNQIPVDTPDGFMMLHMFNAGQSLLLQGVNLADLHPENFAPIADAHLQQDLSAALAYEDGTGLVRPNTVYVRSHEEGLEEIVDFNPATDKISFFYLSVRGDGQRNFAVEDTAEGARFYNPLSGQSLTLRGVSFSDLDSSHFEWRANQLEDGIAGRMGLEGVIDNFSYPSENVFSGKSVAMAGLVDRAPYHSQPEYTGTPIGTGSDPADPGDGSTEDPMDGGSGGYGDNGDNGDTGDNGGTGNSGGSGNDNGTGGNTGNSGPFVGGGQTYSVGQTSVVTGFDPTRDVLDVGPNSIHNQIPVDTPDGLMFLHMFNASQSLLLEGVNLADLHPENFAPISDAHLQQDLSAALAYEDGTGLVRPNTVYVRSHQEGLEEIVDFNPARDKISFFYLSVRGDGGLNFAVEETAQGARFYSPLTGQSLTLRGVSFAELDSAHFEWRANQLEDNIAGRMGLSGVIDGFQYVSENVFSGKSVAMAGLVDRAPYHSQPDYTGTPIGSGSGDDGMGDSGGGDGGSAAAVVVTVTGGSVTEADPGMDHVHEDGSSHVHDDGHRFITFEVSLDAPAAEAITLSYATADGSAVADTTSDIAWDYHEVTGTLVFAPGEQTKSVVVAVHPDTLVEGTETFSLEVSGDAISGVLQATGTIYDDDATDSPADGGMGDHDMGGHDMGGDGSETLDARLSVLNDWGSGAILELEISNTDQSNHSGDWDVMFNLGPGIMNMWNGSYAEAPEGGITVSNASWTADIQAGDTVKIGFQVDQGNLDQDQLNTDAEFYFL